MGRLSLEQGMRAAIRACGMNDAAIARAAGLTPSSVSRFMRGERSWKLETAERVAAALGLGIGPYRPLDESGGTGAARPTRPIRPRGRPGARLDDAALTALASERVELSRSA